MGFQATAAHARSVCGGALAAKLVVWSKDEVQDDEGKHPSADQCGLEDEFYRKQLRCPSGFTRGGTEGLAGDAGKCVKYSSWDRPSCPIGQNRCSTNGHDTCRTKNGCAGDLKGDLECANKNKTYVKNHDGNADYCAQRAVKDATWQVEGDCKAGYFKSKYFVIAAGEQERGIKRYLCTR